MNIHKLKALSLAYVFNDMCPLLGNNCLVRLPYYFGYYLTCSRTLFVRSINNPNHFNKNKIDPILHHTKYLVLDFEATCDNGPNFLKPQEIIEFPCIAIKYSGEHFERLSYFHKYVKPVVHKELTEFCTQLTGINQSIINDSEHFDKVLNQFCQWYEHQSNYGQENCIIVTSGNWDLGRILIEQCELSAIQIPSFMRTWINIKKLFAQTIGKYPYGVRNMMTTLNLKHIGSLHSGIDDCENIITIMNSLAEQGCVFKATNKLS
ncbi:ERI1 exoribonuclease 3-like [Adelges cooleyi]|uniref:ERI1 exoribonuclease 3-like n=1 Tax=Adelges cooleyi TaxID=133065 RepID=UPI0021803690|nr:ERI1 exoribonuclease 3-like [Adelges cooleyi]